MYIYIALARCERASNVRKERMDRAGRVIQWVTARDAVLVLCFAVFLHIFKIHTKMDCGRGLYNYIGHYTASQQVTPKCFIRSE